MIIGWNIQKLNLKCNKPKYDHFEFRFYSAKLNFDKKKKSTLKLEHSFSSARRNRTLFLPLTEIFSSFISSFLFRKQNLKRYEFS